jgi:hypothetical protein
VLSPPDCTAGAAPRAARARADRLDGDERQVDDAGAEDHRQPDEEADLAEGIAAAQHADRRAGTAS